MSLFYLWDGTNNLQGLDSEHTAENHKQHQDMKLPKLSHLRVTSASRMSGYFLSFPSQSSRINFEYFNAWIYNVADSFSTFSNFGAGSEVSRTATIQLKSGFDGSGAGSIFPIFRLFNPSAQAYISKYNAAREVVAQERDPFSLNSKFTFHWVLMILYWKRNMLADFIACVI